MTMKKSKYDTKVYWVKMRSGKWRVAEKRHLNRWFICGNGTIQHYSDFVPYGANTPNIIEIGDEIVCPHK